MRTEDQNSTLGFPIFADDSGAIGTGKTGLTITATLAKNGGTASSVSPTITELGNGIYWVTPIAAHRNTIGCNVWQFAAAGSVIAPAFERIRLAPVVAGDAMALTSGERNSLAAVIESYIVNEGDATAVLQSIADRIAADWVSGDASPLAIVAAMKADATLAAMIVNAAAAKTAAESADGKLSAGRMSRVDRLPDVIAGTTGGLALHGATGGLTEEEADTLDSIAIALAGSSPVEPTGDSVLAKLARIEAGNTDHPLASND